MNVRNFLDGFAETNMFDPLVPTNWYNLNLELLQSTKVKTKIVYFISFINIILSIQGGYSLINKFGVYSRAVIEAYPEIGLDPRKFRGAYGIIK